MAVFSNLRRIVLKTNPHPFANKNIIMKNEVWLRAWKNIKEALKNRLEYPYARYKQNKSEMKMASRNFAEKTEKQNRG